MQNRARFFKAADSLIAKSIATQKGHEALLVAPYVHLKNIIPFLADNFSSLPRHLQNSLLAGLGILLTVSPTLAEADKTAVFYLQDSSRINTYKSEVYNDILGGTTNSYIKNFVNLCNATFINRPSTMAFDLVKSQEYTVLLPAADQASPPLTLATYFDLYRMHTNIAMETFEACLFSNFQDSNSDVTEILKIVGVVIAVAMIGGVIALNWRRCSVRNEEESQELLQLDHIEDYGSTRVHQSTGGYRNH